MKNDALLHQSSKPGIYQRAGKVNGKTSWISSNNNTALWYDAAANDWTIGPLGYLGTSFGGISSTGDQGRLSCPYNVPQDAWQYVENGAWTIADADDVSIECLAGNHNIDLIPPFSNKVQNQNKNMICYKSSFSFDFSPY